MTAFDRGGEIHQAFGENGSTLMKYFVHIPDPAGRIKRSIFSGGLLADHNEVVRIGFRGMTKLALKPGATAISELNIIVTESKSGQSASL
jgi:hypothetical protein